MLDKIRLHHQGLLPQGYNLGFSDATSFDARFCRFWSVDYDQLVQRTLAGGTNEEIFDATFADRLPLNPEHILGWNSLILKRGWRDNSGLATEKAAAGFADRDDIQTFVDLHDVDEGRKPRFA
jgi:gluconokinase